MQLHSFLVRSCLALPCLLLYVISVVVSLFSSFPSLLHSLSSFSFDSLHSYSIGDLTTSQGSTIVVTASPSTSALNISGCLNATGLLQVQVAEGGDYNVRISSSLSSLFLSFSSPHLFRLLSFSIARFRLNIFTVGLSKGSTDAAMVF